MSKAAEMAEKVGDDDQEKVAELLNDASFWYEIAMSYFIKFLTSLLP